MKKNEEKNLSFKLSNTDLEGSDGWCSRPLLLLAGAAVLVVFAVMLIWKEGKSLNLKNVTSQIKDVVRVALCLVELLSSAALSEKAKVPNNRSLISGLAALPAPQRRPADPLTVSSKWTTSISPDFSDRRGT
ncbi:hypothetical protein AOLI_G00128610 [Acnodon oligacanthus]